MKVTRQNEGLRAKHTRNQSSKKGQKHAQPLPTNHYTGCGTVLPKGVDVDRVDVLRVRVTRSIPVAQKVCRETVCAVFVEQRQAYWVLEAHGHADNIARKMLRCKLCS
jgi:hypothetical protein